MNAVASEKLAVANFSEVKFYGVRTRPDAVIVEAHLQTGEVFRFHTTADELRQFGLKCYAQAKVLMGEYEPDPADDARRTN